MSPNTKIDNALIVVIRVFENCSLGCHFCGYSRELHKPRHISSVERLSKFSQVLSQYQKRFDRHIHVSWLGGEPLEWSKLPHLARVFHDENGLSLGITTNGLPLGSSRIRAELIQRYDQVTISIDGLAEFHDSVRGKPGLFEQIRRNIGLLQQCDREGRLLLRVNTILMRGNIDQFPMFCKTMADWGIHEITFNLLGGLYRPETWVTVFGDIGNTLKGKVDFFEGGSHYALERVYSDVIKTRTSRVGTSKDCATQ